MEFLLNGLVIIFAWLGHAFAFTVLLNVVYARPLPRKLLRMSRLLIAVVVFIVPAIALLDNRGSLWPRIVNQPDALGLYLVLCIFIGIIIVPASIFARWRRHQVPNVKSQISRIVDIAKELGHRPAGHGKHWRLARIPGNQIYQVDFTEKNLMLPRLPTSLNGLSILHFGDLHFHGTPEREFFERILEELAKHEVPDLICLTGDFVDTDYHQCWIKPLLGQLQARYGKFAILGNHDYWCEPDEVRKQLRRAGFTVLGREPAILSVRDESIKMLGHEGPWFPAPPSQRYGKGAGGESFRILLSHTPDNILWANQNDIDLMLAGHTHGGQVRFPIMGSVFVPSRYSRKYDSGVFWESPTLIHVTRGVSGREPLRWNCRPEVTLLRLAIADSGH